MRIEKWFETCNADSKCVPGPIARRRRAEEEADGNNSRRAAHRREWQRGRIAGTPNVTSRRSYLFAIISARLVSIASACYGRVTLASLYKSIMRYSRYLPSYRRGRHRTASLTQRKRERETASRNNASSNTFRHLGATGTLRGSPSAHRPPFGIARVFLFSNSLSVKLSHRWIILRFLDSYRFDSDSHVTGSTCCVKILRKSEINLGRL